MTTIRIIAEIKLKTDVKNELMPIFKNLVASSQAEHGNKEYELTESFDNPDHLFVIETWESEQAIALHNESLHFQAFVKAIEGKVELLTVTKVKHLL